MTQMDEWSNLADRFSLIPLNGKVPIEQGWQKWCEERRLFSPKDFIGRNAGIACGPASGVLVLDIDHEKLFRQTLEKNDWSYEPTMTVQTGAGRYHLYFKYPQNGSRYGCTSYKTSVLGETITVFDVRGSGGQVVAPGSIHPDTKKLYRIVRDIEPVPAPHWLCELVEERVETPTEPSNVIQFPLVWDGRVDDLPISSSNKDLIHNGANVGDRSEAIMSVCNSLVFANLSDSQIIDVFESYPIGKKYREKGRTRERWLARHIRKAREYVTEHADITTMSTAGTAGTVESSGTVGVDGVKKEDTGTARVQTRVQVPGRALERNLAAEIREWIFEADGKFSVSDLDRDLSIRTRQEKINRGKALDRILKEGKIERFGTARGYYQTIDGNCPLINFINVDATRSELVLPFNLHNLFFIQPKNVIIIAGDSNAGKTACMVFAMYSTVCELLKRHLLIPVNYYSSEMGPAEWNVRLSKTDITLEWWAQTCNIFQRSENFHQVIDPNAISFIDYLEIHEDFYRVGGMIKAIFDRLVNGVAVIAVQKNRGQTLGLGGNRGIEKARLYLTIRESQPHGYTMTIEKGKNAIGPNKSHHECEFSIWNGWKLKQETPWTKIEEDKRHA